jgi:hypothetical protein
MSGSLFSTRTFVLGSIAAVELACVLGIACLGRGLLPVEAAPNGTNLGPELRSPELATPAVIEDADRGEPERIALSAGAPAGEDERVSPAASPREPRTEREFCSMFRGVAAEGLAPLEVAVRRALAERGPTCRKVAALRVLCESDSPATDEILASAVSHPSDDAKADDAVPRFALYALVARSARLPASRRMLERGTWGEGEIFPTALRAVAAAALASSACEEEIDRIARFLQNERDPLVRAGTIEALVRRRESPARDAALEALGIGRSAESDLRAAEEQDAHRFE